MASSGGGGAQRTGAALPAAALPLHRIPARPLSTRLIMLTYLSGLCRVLVFLGGVQQLLEDDHVPRVCRRTAGHGCPLARPLFLGWPADPAARVADRQWLMGDSVLITPVVEEARPKAHL